MKGTISKQTYITYLPLLLAMKEATQAYWGVKVRVFSKISSFKRAFYNLKSFEDSFETLSLLSTQEENVFLIFNNRDSEKEKCDESRLGKINHSATPRNPLSYEETFSK